MDIAIIGAGWYGCHLALVLAKQHNVTLYEKNQDIFSQLSGQYSIRLHAGPHYPRSKETRRHCQRGFNLFHQIYSELLIENEYSIYALGETDFEGTPSKIDLNTFREVCNESYGCEEINSSAYGYNDVLCAMKIYEPSIALGARLRSKFHDYFNSSNVQVQCNFEVTSLSRHDDKITLSNGVNPRLFDKVINATNYQSLLTVRDNFPIDMEVIYQPCLSLIYKDKQPGIKPISFIVMDGWFPCLMPQITDNIEIDQKADKYCLTHGKWTIMGSYSHPAEAKHVLDNLDKGIKQNIKALVEQDMNRFWPAFADRFEFIGWGGQVAAKLKTRKEFRSAITYEKNGIIEIIPGKVSNIFDVELEIQQLIENKGILRHHDYRYVKNGTLDISANEITEIPKVDEPVTCNLQTYNDLVEQRRPPSTPRFFPNESILQTPNNASPSNLYFDFSCIVLFIKEIIEVLASLFLALHSLLLDLIPSCISSRSSIFLEDESQLPTNISGL